MISVENLKFSYGERLVLDNFNLTVQNGECVCLYGPSGCGKTTVLKLVAGLLSPLNGEIEGAENPSVVFQEDRLLEGFSLKTNVCLPLEKPRHDLAVQMLKEVGLGEALNKKISALSGGMKRRAAIVRAVAFGGDILILDEPFNGIDDKNKVRIAEIIKREYLQKGKPVLLVSHNLDDAKLLNAKIINM